MSQEDRRAKVRRYKESPRRAGIFRVRNTVTGASLIGSSPDLPAMLNRQRFQLEAGTHADHGLQADWDTLGADAFEFEVLDELEPCDDRPPDAEELATLKGLWLERLSGEGVPLYPLSMRGT